MIARLSYQLTTSYISAWITIMNFSFLFGDHWCHWNDFVCFIFWVFIFLPVLPRWLATFRFVNLLKTNIRFIYFLNCFWCVVAGEQLTLEACSDGDFEASCSPDYVIVTSAVYGRFYNLDQANRNCFTKDYGFLGRNESVLPEVGVKIRPQYHSRGEVKSFFIVARWQHSAQVERRASSRSVIISNINSPTSTPISFELSASRSSAKQVRSRSRDVIIV